MDKFNLSENGKELIKYKGHDSLVEIPEGVEIIKTNAFEECECITSIKLPMSIKQIGRQAINECVNLSEIFFPKDPDADCTGCSICSCLKLNSTIIIGNRLIRVPQSFKGTYVIPKGITEISEGAFCKCNLITEIIIPNGLKKIGFAAFKECICLSTIEIPDSVDIIGADAFSQCYRLTEITIPRNISKLGFRAFDCSSITKVILQEGSKYFFWCAFIRCPNLKDIIIPDSVQPFMFVEGERGHNPFLSFRLRESIDNPLYNKHTFFGLPTGFSGVYSVPEGISNIESCAFKNCAEVTTIKLPSSIKAIGDAAFSGCEKLEVINLNEHIKIGSNAFYDCISLQHSIVIGKRIIRVSPKVQDFIIDNDITSIDKYAFHKCDQLTSIFIPKNVEMIGNYAFSECGALEAVIFEDGSRVKDIGSGAFSECDSLQRIIIPRGVTKILGETFKDCISLYEIMIPSSVESINNTAFSGCPNIDVAYMSGRWNNSKRIELGLPIARYNYFMDYFDDIDVYDELELEESYEYKKYKKYKIYEDYLDNEQFYNSGHGYLDASEWRNYSKGDLGSTNDGEMLFTNGRLWPCPYCGFDGTTTYSDGTARCDRCHRWFRYA